MASGAGNQGANVALLEVRMSVLSVLACLFAVSVWLMFTLKYAPHSLGIFVSFMFIALVVESLMQRKRKIRSSNS